jgi:ribonucrease Y
MIVLAQSIGENAIYLLSGGVIVLIGVSFFDLSRLRRFERRRIELQEKTRAEIEQVKAEGRSEAKAESDALRHATEERLASREGKIAEREQQIHQREVLLNGQLERLSGWEQKLAAQQEHVSDSEKLLASRETALTETELLWEQRLAEVAGLSIAQAREQVLKNAELRARQESAEMSRRILESAKADAEDQARKIIGIAIQRYAGDHTSESTTAAVALKGDDIKGRIIGREGRNIRAFENATGMTVLIDDTPNAVVLSGFDPVRREIARESMERLVADGRIHPARIEEVVEKVSSEIEGRILQVAEEAVCKLGLAPVHQEISKRLGRLYFRLSYSQNILDHSVEVARITGLLAAEVGANVEDATRAGLLHDIGKAIGDEMPGSHALVGAEFIRRHGENEAVVDGVASHHDEVEHETVLGILVSAADAISAARPGARLEPVTSYINRLKSLEEVGLSFEGVERCFAVQAGREVRVFVRPDQVDDEAAATLAKTICRKIEDELQYPGQIRVTVIRETRCVDFAK